MPNPVRHIMTIVSALISLLRTAFLQLRLRADNRIYRNLSFQDIEKKYTGRAVNFQLESWRTIHSERGPLYYFYESTNGKTHRRLTVELPRHVYLANGAGIFTSAGVVYNPYYNCVVLESLESWGTDVNKSTEYHLIRKQPRRSLDGLSLSLLSLGAVGNYAHFMFDSMPKLYLVRDLRIDFKWVLMPGPKQLWKSRILDYLGLSDRAVWVEQHEEIFCEQLMFTNRVNYTRHCSPFAVKAVRKLFLQGMPNGVIPHRLIFASRKNAKDRRNRFEDLFQNLLPDSFDIIDFETLSIEETMRICQETKLFAGIHGAAFANLVFCNPGTSVIELRPDDILPEGHWHYYTTLCEELSLDHKVYSLLDSMQDTDLKNIIARVMDTAEKLVNVSR